MYLGDIRLWFGFLYMIFKDLFGVFMKFFSFYKSEGDNRNLLIC